MKSVKYGVIGLGWFGEKHCEALAAIPNVEMYALCTRTPSRLAEVAERFGVQRTYQLQQDAGRSGWGRQRGRWTSIGRLPWPR